MNVDTVNPCPTCGEIPVNEMHNIIPVLNKVQLSIVGSVLGALLAVTLIFVVRFLINYGKREK